MAALVAATVKTALETYLGVEWGKDAVQYKNSIAADTCVLYDSYGNAVTVRAPELLHYTDKDFSTTYPTVAVTGTLIAGGVSEAEIVTGGETLILTLTGGTWAAAGAAFDALRQAFIDALDSNMAEAHGWDADLKAVMAVTTVVRTSDTIVTITTPAAAAYAITKDEVVSISVPANSVVYANGTTVNRAFTPDITSFTISSIAAALTGTFLTTPTESEVVTGGQTIIITLTGGTWAPAAGSAFDNQRQNIINGLTSAGAAAGGWNAQVRDVMAVTTVVRTSNTVVTVTLPATAGYTITSNETVTVTIPASALVTADAAAAVNAVVAAPTIPIVANS